MDNLYDSSAGGTISDNYGSVNAYMFSNAAWIIPTVTGSVSTVSSILIISVILRSSQESRFTSYHIIMLFMSFWDAIASIGMALTTIPMPSDIQDVYPFSGKSFGNIGTCRAQGFLVTLGTMIALTSNCALNIYYLCAMRYNMAEDKIKRKVLPIMLVIFTAFPLFIMFAALNLGQIHPQNISNHCSLGTDPYASDDFEEMHWIGILFIIFLGVCFFVIVSSLMVLVVTAFRAEMDIRRSMRRITRRSRMVHLRSSAATSTRTPTRTRIRTFERTRAVLFQSFMYIAAMVLTHVWIVLLFIEFAYVKGHPDYVPNKSIVIAAWIFRPLQGFFNAVIFIYQKAYSLCRANRRRQLRLFDAMKQVIISPSAVPALLISGMEVAAETEEAEVRPPNQQLSLVRWGADSLIAQYLVAEDGIQGASNLGDDVNIDTASVAALSDIDDRDIYDFDSSNAYSTSIGGLPSVAEEDEDCDDEDDA